MYPIQKDSVGNDFITISSHDNEFVRITFVPNGWTGGPCLRFQVQDETGRLRQGPEFPASKLGELVLASTKLVFEN